MEHMFPEARRKGAVSADQARGGGGGWERWETRRYNQPHSRWTVPGRARQHGLEDGVITQAGVREGGREGRKEEGRG